MKCPKCGCLEDKVIDSRTSREGLTVRRRRECVECAKRYTTLEEIVPSEMFVTKRDGTREAFNPNKIRDGIRKACEKRPVGEGALDGVLARIVTRLEALNEREIGSECIGDFVIDELQELDQIAYVRFASVYRDFKDIDQFIREIRMLGNNSVNKR